MKTKTKTRIKLAIFSIAVACTASSSILAGTNKQLDANALGEKIEFTGLGDPLKGRFFGPLPFEDFLTFQLPDSAPRWRIAGELSGPGKPDCLLGILCGTAGFSEMQLSLEHQVGGAWQAMRTWHDASSGKGDRIGIAFGDELGLLASGKYGLRVSGIGHNAVASSPSYGVSVVAAPVPEPETYALLLAGLGLLGAQARRQRP